MVYDFRVARGDSKLWRGDAVTEADAEEGRGPSGADRDEDGREKRPPLNILVPKFLVAKSLLLGGLVPVSGDRKSGDSVAKLRGGSDGAVEAGGLDEENTECELDLLLDLEGEDDGHLSIVAGCTGNGGSGALGVSERADTGVESFRRRRLQKDDFLDRFFSSPSVCISSTSFSFPFPFPSPNNAAPTDNLLFTLDSTSSVSE